METLDFLIFIVVADVALIMILDIRRSVINVRKEPYFVHFDSRFHTLNDVVENIVAYKCLRGQKKQFYMQKFKGQLHGNIFMFCQSPVYTSMMNLNLLCIILLDTSFKQRSLQIKSGRSRLKWLLLHCCTRLVKVSVGGQGKCSSDTAYHLQRGKLQTKKQW